VAVVVAVSFPSPELSRRESFRCTAKMDEVLNSIVGHVEVARSLGIRLVSLAGQARGGDGTARAEHVQEAFASQDAAVRQVLESVHTRIMAFDKSEAMAVSGDSQGSGFDNGLFGRSSALDPATPAGFYEDAEASRTIAIKAVARDIAHTLESEVSWRKNTFYNACDVNRYFHQQLAKAFPEVPVGPERRGELESETTPPTNSTQDVQKQLAAASLEQTLQGLRGLANFTIEHATAGKGMKRLTCEWKVGLNTTIDFEHTKSVSQPMETTTAAPSSPNNLKNLRTVWVQVESRVDTSQVSAEQTELTLARDLTIKAQQWHFQLVQDLGEQHAVLELLKWFSTTFASLSATRLDSDFASPLHLQSVNA